MSICAAFNAAKNLGLSDDDAVWSMRTCEPTPYEKEIVNEITRFSKHLKVYNKDLIKASILTVKRYPHKYPDLAYPLIINTNIDNLLQIIDWLIV